MDMADRIKQQRIKMGYTQEELGQKLGLQKSAIAKYENGRVENMKRSVIVNMAKVLECSPAYLMGWEAEAPEEKPALTARDERDIKKTWTVSWKSSPQERPGLPAMTVKASIRKLRNCLRMNWK